MERTEDTREKLLEATLELISEKGYMGATTREIAARAGVSEITLFRKFGKKEKLFEEMLRNYTFLPRLKDLLREIDELHVEDGLTTIGIRFLQTLRDRRALVQIIMSEITTYPRKVRSIYQQMIENVGRVLTTYLEDRRDRGEVRGAALEVAALAFLRTLFVTFLNDSVIGGRTLADRDIESVVSTHVDIFLNGITADRGG